MQKVCKSLQKGIPKGSQNEEKTYKITMPKFEAFRSRPFDITGGGGPPGGAPRGAVRDHLNPKLGGQRGESRRHSHSLLTLVGSADSRPKPHAVDPQNITRVKKKCQQFKSLKTYHV